MIYISADHAGYQLKKELVDYLAKKLELKITDLGPKEYDKDDDFVDYAVNLAKKVAEDNKNRGILICGSGHGMCIAANKIKGIKAIVGYSISGAELGRQHNDANILCLAGKIISKDHAEAIVKKFLETEFKNEPRFIRRNEKISELEK
jgi:ribose 5-phosphate isomerase B